jgi:hypothetical protein
LTFVSFRNDRKVGLLGLTISISFIPIRPIDQMFRIKSRMSCPDRSFLP